MAMQVVAHYGREYKFLSGLSRVGCATCLHTRIHSMKEIEQKIKKQEKKRQGLSSGLSLSIINDADNLSSMNQLSYKRRKK